MLQLIAASLHPGLTTVALPHYGMGSWAANRLINAIETGSTEAETAAAGPGKPGGGHARPVLLGCPLVSRASVAARRDRP